MSGTERREEDRRVMRAIEDYLGTPSAAAIDRSRQELDGWFRETAETLWWSALATPLGDLYLAAGLEGLRRVSFAETREKFLRGLNARARLIEDSEPLAEYCRQLQEYFEGRRRRFSMALDLSTVTSFQQRVLVAADAIPVGEVRTYGEIAQALGKPKAARAVGQALGRNPLPIVLPCHRVIASDGSLGGYGGGLERKRQLLQLEGAR